jgi:hypothetical protein
VYNMHIISLNTHGLFSSIKNMFTEI